MINKITKTITLLLSFQLTQTAFAQDTVASATLSKANIEKQVQEFMAKEDIPALAIGIIQNGKVTFTSAHGVRDRKTNRPINQKPYSKLARTLKH